MPQTEKISLLQECRQIMTKRMRASITGMLNEIDETLLKMAQERTGFMSESSCYEAIREIRLKRIEIKLRFERRFINLFEKEIRIPKQAEQQACVETQAELLFRNLNEEESLSMENSVGAVRRSCGQALLDLDNKFGLLLDTAKSVNPMQPEIIFEAFREACWDIKSGDEVKSMMFEIFERRIAGELQDIYQELNKLLEKQNGPVTTNNSESKIAFSVLPKQEQQLVMLRYEVITQIEKRLDGHEVPSFARAFLLKHWRIFLEHIVTKYSENSIAWNAARQTMDDLIWSVRKTSTIYDRHRLVQLLPSLLFRLINGMKVISMNAADMERFLKELRDHQLSALDKIDSQLLSAIADEAIESVSRSSPKVYH